MAEQSLELQEDQFLREVRKAGNARLLAENELWNEIISERKATLIEALLQLEPDAFEAMREVKIALKVLQSLEDRVGELVETGQLASQSLKELQDGRGANNQRKRRASG